MRKVLLATTALVAVGGITAANADISISGNYEWEYEMTDTGTVFGDDGHINITAVEAADNGMTWTAVHTLAGGSDAVARNSADTASTSFVASFKAAPSFPVSTVNAWIVVATVVAAIPPAKPPICPNIPPIPPPNAPAAPTKGP